MKTNTYKRLHRQIIRKILEKKQKNFIEVNETLGLLKIQVSLSTEFATVAHVASGQVLKDGPT